MKPLQRLLSALPLMMSLLATAPSRAEVSLTELQWALCEDSVDAALKKMNGRAEHRKDFEISYFDSADFDLFRSQVFLHLQIKGQEWVSKAKLKLVESDLEMVAWMDEHRARCEEDFYRDQRELRCSIRAKSAEPDELWSHEQQAMLDTFKPSWKKASLREWGPYRVREAKFRQSISSRKVLDFTLNETYIAQDKTPLIELSTRVSRAQADFIFWSTTEKLQKEGVNLCPRQVGKFERIVEIMGQR